MLSVPSLNALVVKMKSCLQETYNILRIPAKESTVIPVLSKETLHGWVTRATKLHPWTTCCRDARAGAATDAGTHGRSAQQRGAVLGLTLVLLMRLRSLPIFLKLPLSAQPMLIRLPRRQLAQPRQLETCGINLGSNDAIGILVLPRRATAKDFDGALGLVPRPREDCTDESWG